MPRVVPSQVVAFIDSTFSGTLSSNNWGRGYAGQLAGLVDLVDKIPEELLTMDGGAYASLIAAKGHIRERLAAWSHDRSARGELDFVGGHSPIALIREALAKCPDESAAATTSELGFIPDSALRENLRIDIAAVHRAFSNGEWKAATVIGGSLIEALLLWALQQCPPTDVTAAIANLRTAGGLRGKQASGSLDEWHLDEYIKVAEEVRIIQKDAATQSRLAKDFRNLVHPGRSQRLAQQCDRATALSTLAGMEHVIRDLAKRKKATTGGL